MGRSTGKDEMKVFQNDLLCNSLGKEKERLIRFDQANEA